MYKGIKTQRAKRHKLNERKLNHGALSNANPCTSFTSLERIITFQILDLRREFEIMHAHDDYL